MPSKRQIVNERMFKQWDIFTKMTVAYVSVGFILVIVAFSTVCNQKIK